MVRSLGDLHPVGLYSDDPYFIGPTEPPGFSHPDNSGDYQGADQDTSEALKDFSFWAGIISSITDLTKNLLKAKGDSDLKKGLDKAKDKIDQGKTGMSESGQKIGDALTDINDNNITVTNLTGDLGNISNSINVQLSNLSDIAQSLTGFNGQLSQQTADLESAQQRLDQALSRTDLSLSQKRVEVRSANYGLMQKGLALNETNFQIANATESYNMIGDQLTQNIATATGLRSDLSTAYARDQQYRGDLNSGVENYNQSAKTYSEGFQGARDSIQNNKDLQTNVLYPMAEGSSGLRGAGQVASAVSDGKFGEATGIALANGTQAYVRNGGPAQIGMAQGLIGAVTIGAGRAVDSTLKSGGDFGQGMLNFASEVGQATLRTSDMMRVSSGLDTAFTALNNSSNPGRVYDAFQIGVQEVGPSVSIISSWVATATSLIPGAQGFSPAVGMVAKALPALAQGSVATIGETVNKLATSGVSGSVGNYPDRGIGRGLLDRFSGGTTSAPVIAVGGLLTSVWNSAKAVTIGLINNNDYAMNASATVNALANTGAIKPTLPPQSVTVRPGFVGDAPNAGE